jgi:hypothetical protein
MPSETFIINYQFSWLHISEDWIIHMGTLCTYPYVTQYKMFSVVCKHLIQHYRLFLLLSERKVNGTDRGKTLTCITTQRESNVHGSVHRNNILVYKSQQDAHIAEFIFVWELLYMFRVSLSPIFRSTKQL